jgi:cytochrome b6-f complex iron-sulfur subunit
MQTEGGTVDTMRTETEGSGYAGYQEKEAACTSRREFVRYAGAGVLLAALGVTLTSCSENASITDSGGGSGGGGSAGVLVQGNVITIDLNQATTLASAGGFLFIGQAQTIVVNVDGSTIRAFTSVCTHEQCNVTQFTGSTFVCPCHGSRYNTSGQVVQGPALLALTEFSVSRSGSTVTITK